MLRDNPVAVRPLWTRCVAQELKTIGADVETALAECRLDWRSLNKADGWIPFVGHGQLLEIAARELKNDIYGMTSAGQVDVRDGDVLAYLGLASDTLEAALRMDAHASEVSTAIPVKPSRFRDNEAKILAAKMSARRLEPRQGAGGRGRVHDAPQARFGLFRERPGRAAARELRHHG